MSKKAAEDQSPVWATVGSVERAYSLPRTMIYQGINNGKIESRIVGQTPNKRGRRMVQLDSVEEFIRRSPRQPLPSIRRAMAKLAKASAVARRVAKLARHRRVKGGAK
jgi:hypothetical protein